MCEQTNNFFVDVALAECAKNMEAQKNYSFIYLLCKWG